MRRHSTPTCLFIAFSISALFYVHAAEPRETQLAFDRPFEVPTMEAPRTDVEPFQYKNVGKKIPNYTRSAQWGTQGEPLSEMQLPLDAEQSQRHIITPKGFRAALFADEQLWDGGKPICMAWDERGRLWIALTVDYPNELQPAAGRDRIVICEDTDGDGRADRATQFAEGLSIPTSIAFHRGGAIVQNGVETIYLKDIDADDRADERRVLFSGWGMRDTHGGVSNFQYNLDNWVWAMQGYNSSRPVVQGEEQQAFRQGFFRFRPDGSALEFIRSTDNNTWGLGISEEGIIFGSTANRNPSVFMPIPNRYYESVRGWAPSLVLRTIADSYLFRAVTDKVRQVDQHGGYTAGAGHSLYTARNYPEAYWNRTAFVTEPTGHLVGTFVIESEGSGFRSSNLFNLMASDDEWTAPIMAEVGPDGNVWVLDWYNYIVQHNPTPHGFETGRGAAYETDLRDKRYGRIYRIVHEGATEFEMFSLAGATPAKLTEVLTHDNLLWRRHAQRLLVERGDTDVLPSLLELVADQSVDAIGLNVGAIHALWTMHGLGVLDGEHPEATAAALEALRHPAPGVRRNAVQVLPHGTQAVQAILAAGLLDDGNLQVRLMALLALADQPADSAAGEALAGVLLDPRNAEDRWIAEATTAAAANNSQQFLTALAQQQDPPEKQLEVATIVAEHFARGIPADSIRPLLAALAEADPRVAAAVVQGLSLGWPAQSPPEVDAELDEHLARVAERLAPEHRGKVIRLAIGWGSERFENMARDFMHAALARVADDSAPLRERLAAAREYVGYTATNAKEADRLLDLVTPRTAPELAAGILQAMAAIENPELGESVLERLAGLTPATRAAGMSVLLSRPEWTQSLLKGADQGVVQLTELSLDQRQMLMNHPDRSIRNHARALLRRGGALPSADRQAVIQQLLPLTHEPGDALAGKEVFVKHCAKCHRHSGEGTQIGPDLTGMAVHPKEQLLTEIIDPSRSVEANFRVYTIATADGRVLSGLLASESRTALELFDAEGKKLTVLREDIDEFLATSKSLMPEGFEKQLSSTDMVNLLEFLTQRGKYVPLPLDKVATAVSTRGMFNSPESRAERLEFDDWSPKTFADVPFVLVDPQEGRVENVVLLNGPQGELPPHMPRSVTLPVNMPVKTIHMLSGVSGWGFPFSQQKSVSVIVRLRYADGSVEEHPLRNGEHFADYIRRTDVPGSEFAFDLAGRQIRYLTVQPQRQEPITEIELVKGPDSTAPVVMAVTLEALESG